MPYTFKYPNLIQVAGLTGSPGPTVELTDQGRSELGIRKEEIKSDQRLANGTLKKYTIALKHTFTLSWSMVPATTAKTIDGKSGRNDMKNLYQNNYGNNVTFSWRESDNSLQTYTVFISSYNETLVKRWGSFFWNVSLEFVEI